MMLPVVSIMLMARGQVTPADGYIGTSENAANGTVDLALNPPRGGRVMVDNVDVVSLIVFFSCRGGGVFFLSVLLRGPPRGSLYRGTPRL